MRKTGYIKLHRNFLDWGWYHNTAVTKVFLYLLLTANYTHSEYMGIKLRPGQTVAGRKSLAEATRLTESQVRTAIAKLKSTGEITTEKAGNFSVITLMGWEKYQATEAGEATAELPDVSPKESPPNRQEIATDSPHYKNIKKYKNIKEFNTHTRVKESSYAKSKPEVYSVGNYNYDAILKMSRERIHKRIEETALPQANEKDEDF